MLQNIIKVVASRKESSFHKNKQTNKQNKTKYKSKKHKLQRLEDKNSSILWSKQYFDIKEVPYLILVYLLICYFHINLYILSRLITVLRYGLEITFQLPGLEIRIPEPGAISLKIARKLLLVHFIVNNLFREPGTFYHPPGANFLFWSFYFKACNVNSVEDISWNLPLRC